MGTAATAQPVYLSTAAIAATMGVHQNTVLNWIRDGVYGPIGRVVRLAARKVGATWRVSEQELADFVQACNNKPVPKTYRTPTQERRQAERDRDALHKILNER